MDPSLAVTPRPYHHGDLKAALLAHAEAILEQQGIGALTLRAAARAAGVSHAAPRNHFQDLTGLLSELAAVGFGRFSATLAGAMSEAGDDPRARLHAMGLAYVGFARRSPGLFTLMFRSDRLDPAHPALRDAIQTARDALRDAIAARSDAAFGTPLQRAAQATAVWSLVHGFSVLLLNGRLDGLLRQFPDVDADALLDAVLQVVEIAG